MGAPKEKRSPSSPYSARISVLFRLADHVELSQPRLRGGSRKRLSVTEPVTGIVANAAHGN